MKSEFLVLGLCVQFLSIGAHFHPLDPYAPHDPNNGYPMHFCELNDDEFGRPYLGPYDQHVDSSARNPFPKVPAPVTPRRRPKQKPKAKVSKSALEDETVNSAPTTDRDRFMKRQTAPFPACTALNECSAPQELCNGSDTQYDSCERRCSCVGGVLTNCCRVRKDWRSMTQTERCRYVDAFLTISTEPQYKPCYDSLVKLHTQFFGSGIHGTMNFLPWHRWYILQLENLLRKVDCRVTAPYWDWSLESQSWQNSIIWNDTCGFGGNGDVITNSLLVTTGPFSCETWTQPNGNPVTRNFNNVLPDCAAVALAQRMSVGQFNTWHNRISGTFHNSIHCNIGGTMCTADSANDPIFFLHHGFIDRMWSDWQSNGPSYKNLAFYSTNTNPMPGAFGATPAMVYDLQNQPGCVKVCIQQPTMACCTNTTYAPVCTRDMNGKSYSPLKLSRLIHRPFPNVSEASFQLFHATYEDRVMSKRFSNLMNDYKQLNAVLFDNGYTNEMLKSSGTVNGFVDFERYLYRPQSFANNMWASDMPKVCVPYLYGE